MLCFRCARRAVLGLSRPSPSSSWSHGPRVLRLATNPASSRRLTSLVPRRPVAAAAAVDLDVAPKISSHPALAATQVRGGPRDTFRPSHFVRKRRHGFLNRVRTRKGRAILRRRRAKGRSTLSH